jgi:RNA polymerase-binding transcription factor DksA
LHAVPEVQTCVRCQDRIERFGRRFAREATAFPFEEG